MAASQIGSVRCSRARSVCDNHSTDLKNSTSAGDGIAGRAGGAGTPRCFWREGTKQGRSRCGHSICGVLNRHSRNWVDAGLGHNLRKRGAPRRAQFSRGGGWSLSRVRSMELVIHNGLRRRRVRDEMSRDGRRDGRAV